jgi:Abnormal spindle-like microcephaly-assoc'd, ASPM-SPD-2-Hydin
VKIQPGASIQLPVIFTPTAKGWTDGSLTLASNALNSPLNIHVAGTGVSSGPELGVTPATLSFGNVTVGSSASLQATLTASNAAVTISSDQSTSSEFAILGLNLPVTVPAGKSIPVIIQFTPNASGTASGKAGFISNAVNSPTVEQLTGMGVAKGSHTVDLSWNPGDGNAVGYNVYRGTVSRGPYTMINTSLDSSTNYTDNTVVSGATYYYVATEVNAQGQESAYSNEVKAVIPNP